MCLARRDRVWERMLEGSRPGPILKVSSLHLPRGGSIGRALTSGARGRQFDPCSCHLWCLVDKHRVRGFSRGSPVSSHLLHSTNSSHHPSSLSQSCLKAFKSNSLQFNSNKVDAKLSAATYNVDN